MRWLGMVAHACNASTLRGGGGWITWNKKFETNLANMVKPCLYRKYKTGWVWWHLPIISATQEAETWESLEPRRQRLQWAKIMPLHSSLTTVGDSISKKSKEKRKERREQRKTGTKKGGNKERSPVKLDSVSPWQPHFNLISPRKALCKHSHGLEPIHMTSFNLITSVQSLFPKTFCGSLG